MAEVKKGFISSIRRIRDIPHARVIPSDAPDSPTAELRIQQDQGESLPNKGAEVSYIEYEDGTGLILLNTIEGGGEDPGTITNWDIEYIMSN